MSHWPGRGGEGRALLSRRRTIKVPFPPNILLYSWSDVTAACLTCRPAARRGTASWIPRPCQRGLQRPGRASCDGVFHLCSGAEPGASAPPKSPGWTLGNKLFPPVCRQKASKKRNKCVSQNSSLDPRLSLSLLLGSQESARGRGRSGEALPGRRDDDTGGRGKGPEGNDTF